MYFQVFGMCLHTFQVSLPVLYYVKRSKDQNRLTAKTKRQTQQRPTVNDENSDLMNQKVLVDIFCI